MNTRAYAVAIAALLWGILTWQAISAAEERGVRKARLERLAAQIETLEVRVQKLDTVYLTDTIRLARWRTVWDSVRVTDTVVRDSVVYVARGAADSTISACYAVVRSCEARLAARDSLASSLRAGLTQARANDSKVGVWADRALWLGAGIGVGAILRIAK